MATHSFSSPHLLYFNLLVIFSTKKHKMVPKIRANRFICLLDHTYEVLRKAFWGGLEPSMLPW